MHPLKRWLEAKGMTQRALAELLGAHENTIGQIINGKKSAPAWIVEKLEEISDGELEAEDFGERDRQSDQYTSALTRIFAQ